MDESMKQYRDHLVLAEQKAQTDFDKTVIALSGGALGISLAFVKDIVGPQAMSTTCALLASWISWALSVTVVLFSYFFSHLALRKAIGQVDRGEIANVRPGGAYDLITATLNVAGAILFLVGVILIVIFATANLRS